MHRSILRNSLRLVVVACGLGIAGAALAAVPQRIRGDIVSVDGNRLELKSSTGRNIVIELPSDVRVSLRVPASLDAIKQGAFLGATAKPGAKGMLVASEVHIFPESMRGTGEGHRPMTGMPGNTMTNATVSEVSNAPASQHTKTNATVTSIGASGGARTMKLTYKGGEQTIVVPPDTPVVMVEPGNRDSLIAGAHVIVYATRGAEGKLAAQRISVGKNGSVPPI
jgi:hypothetical protein